MANLYYATYYNQHGAYCGVTSWGNDPYTVAECKRRALEDGITGLILRSEPTAPRQLTFQYVMHLKANGERTYVRVTMLEFYQIMKLHAKAAPPARQTVEAESKQSPQGYGNFSFTAWLKEVVQESEEVDELERLYKAPAYGEDR